MGMQHITALASGLIFGIGLTVSGMVNPAKVQNFMDITGQFDPSLIFVMGGGVVVTIIGYRIVFQREQPLFADRFHLPTVKVIDARLLAGAALFGTGWGLSGFCPGPAMASLVFGHVESVVFVVAMAIGALAAHLVPEQT